MTRYAFGQLALALVIAAAGAVKAVRVLVDAADDMTSNVRCLR